MTSSPLSHLSAESAVEVTHFYGLFSVMQGLPLSHVILGGSENVVALYRESLVGLGRLAATIHSTAPTSGVFHLRLLSQTFVGYSLSGTVPFFILLQISNQSLHEILLKSIQISHVLLLLYEPYLADVGSRIESELATSMNSASFAGGGLDENTDAYYDEIFSIFEDHYVNCLLKIPEVSSLYTSPLPHCPDIRAMFEEQEDRLLKSNIDIPQFPFTFSIHMLYDNSMDDIDIPILPSKNQFCDFAGCQNVGALLRFYRLLFQESAEMHRSLSDVSALDLNYLLKSSIILELDALTVSSSPQQDSTAVVVSATQKDNFYFAMTIPAHWVDKSVKISPDHLLLKKHNGGTHAHLPESGVHLYALDSLRGTVLQCWTALLCRFMLYFPLEFPLIPSQSNIDVKSSIKKANCDVLNALTVDQVTSLLMPNAPNPSELGGLVPKPPSTSSSLSYDSITDRTLSRPSVLKKSKMNAVESTNGDLKV